MTEAVPSLVIFRKKEMKKGVSEKDSYVYQNARESFQILYQKLLTDYETNILGYDQHILGEFNEMEQNRKLYSVKHDLNARANLCNFHLFTNVELKVPVY